MTTTKWRLVPTAPDQAWTDAFASRGPRIGSFGATIRAVLDTAPAPALDLARTLQEVRASLAFLPAADAAITGLDHIMLTIAPQDAGRADAPPADPAAAPALDTSAFRVSVPRMSGGCVVYDLTSATDSDSGIAKKLVEMGWAPPGAPVAGEAFAWFQNDAAKGEPPHYSQVSNEYAGELDVFPLYAAPQASEADCSCQSGNGSLRHLCAEHAGFKEQRSGPYQTLFTYSSQPCRNEIAWRFGEACSRAARAPAGDYIDKGLGLLKELQAAGYGIASLAAQPTDPKADRNG